MTEWDFLLVPYGGQSACSDLELRVLLSRDVSSAESSSLISFQFSLSGPVEQVSQVLWPKTVAVPERKDGLWQSTCCELFIGSKLSKTYFELNLSPSGDWNLYAFDDYRSGMVRVETASAPLRKRESHGLKGEIDISQLNVRSEQSGDIVLGLTAVLEFKSGAKEYWALAHKGEKPDFHLRSSFTASL